MPETPGNPALIDDLKEAGKYIPTYTVYEQTAEGKTIKVTKPLPICCTNCYRKVENPRSASYRKYVANFKKRLASGTSSGSIPK